MALSEEEIHNNLARFVKTEQAAHEYGTSNPNELYLELDNLRLRVIDAIRKDPNKKVVQKGMFLVGGTYLNFDIYLDESSQEPVIITQSKIHLQGKPTTVQQAHLTHDSFTIKEGPQIPDGSFSPISSFTLPQDTPASLTLDNSCKIHEFIRGPLDLYLSRATKRQ